MMDIFVLKYFFSFGNFFPTESLEFHNTQIFQIFTWYYFSLYCGIPSVVYLLQTFKILISTIEPKA